ncbi:MAG: SRPBCC domain-containing protein [Ginsengibacter sp.]
MEPHEITTNEVKTKADFRAQTEAKKIPKAVADGIGGMIVAVAEVSGTPEQAFNALTTNEVENWWKYPGLYYQRDWHADLHPCGAWDVTVQLKNGNMVRGFGEFCEVIFPDKVVMTRRFSAHPFLGDRETTITYRFQPSAYGTLITVRDEGFIGRSEAAYGNAEIWEKVLGWLDEYLTQKNSKAN